MHTDFLFKSLVLALSAMILACADGRGGEAGKGNSQTGQTEETKPLRYKEDFIRGREASGNINDNLRGITEFSPMVLLGKQARGLISESKFESFVLDELEKSKVPITRNTGPVGLAFYVTTVTLAGGITGYEVRIFASEKVEAFRKGKRHILYGTTWSKQVNGAGIFSSDQLISAISRDMSTLIRNFAGSYHAKN